MTYSVTNASKRTIIGNLGDGSTLILHVKETIEITDKQYNGYIRGLVDKGMVYVHEKKIESVATAEKPKKKDKGV